MPCCSTTAACGPRRCRRPRARRSRWSRRPRARRRRRGVERFTHGTTIATNALLERKGARTAFVATEGVRAPAPPAPPDPRASLPALRAASGAARAARALLRRAASGSGPTACSSRSTSNRLPEIDAEAVAVCLLFAFRDSSHERAVAEELRRRLPGRARRRVARDLPGVPRVRARLDDGRRRVPRARCSPATCVAGGAVCARRGCPSRSSCARPAASRRSRRLRASLRSRSSPGPAGGCRRGGLGRRAGGVENAISFDMGGTSTDVCLIVGRRRPSGRPSATSAACRSGCRRVDIHTVGAGGGSIVWRRRGGALRVGPQSAGADPGPACYGRGGTRPTVTDANLVLGRLPGALAGRARARPRRGRAGPRRLRPGGGRRRRERRDAARAPGRLGRARPRSARLRARRVRRRRAAARVRARRASSGSERCSSRRRRACSPRSGSSRATSGATTCARTCARSRRPASSPDEGEADLRYRGQSFELTVPLGGDLAERFHRAHEERYGYADRGRRSSSSPCGRPTCGRARPRAPRRPPLDVAGPAVVELDGATCWVPPGWVGAREGNSTLILTTNVKIELQVIGSALRAVAEEMGAVLVRSAFSANIKERRDCSTALFDERGRMIAQAEHIPVHLGAMPEAVAAVIARDPQPGEIFVLNDPFTGGTHLPDITLVSRTEVGFAVSRAHHADVGGMEPASLPADSRELSRKAWSSRPSRLDDEVLTAPRSRTCATRMSVAATCGRRSPRIASPSGGSASSASARAASGRGGDGRALRLLGASSSGPAIAGLPDGRYEAADVSRGRSKASSRSAPRSRSPATRSRSTSPARRRSTTATSTARSRSRDRPATSSSAA